MRRQLGEVNSVSVVICMCMRATKGGESELSCLSHGSRCVNNTLIQMRKNQSVEGPEHHSPIHSLPSSSSDSDIDPSSSAHHWCPSIPTPPLLPLSGPLGHSLKFWVGRPRVFWHNFAKCPVCAQAHSWTQIHCFTEPNYGLACLLSLISHKVVTC